MYKLANGGIGYKKLLSEHEFLQVQRRARELMKDGTNLASIFIKEQTLIYKTKSSDFAHNKITYTQRLYIEQASFENVLKAKNFKDLERIMLNGGLKVHCNCPAFSFWGYKYKAWKMHYGLEKEMRRPVVRNPFGKGYVCKHLFLVLGTFPFYSKDLAKKFGQYWENELKR